MQEHPLNNIKINWYRTLIPRDRLKELNRRSDARGLLQSVSFLALMFASGFASFYVFKNFAWPWLIPMLLIHGSIFAFLINAVHELSHGTVFKTKWLNTFFIHVFAFFGWHNHLFFRASHIKHHQNTLHFPQDSEVILPISYTLKDLFYGSLINPLEFKYQMARHIRFATGRFQGDWEIFLMADLKLRKSVINWSRILLAGHLAIACFCLYFRWWIIPVLSSLGTFYGGLIFFLLNNTQHVGLRSNVNDFRLNCRTIQVHPLFRYLYWNMGWHIEHHMYTAVPFYNLKKLHKEVSHDLPPTPCGLFTIWRDIRCIMARQKREPGFEYTPVLPTQKRDSAG